MKSEGVNQICHFITSSTVRTDFMLEQSTGITSSDLGYNFFLFFKNIFLSAVKASLGHQVNYDALDGC